MPDFDEWKRQVDEWYRKIYGITLADAGDSDEDLRRHFPDMEPKEYVQWIGDKRDLDPVGKWSGGY